ncbi:hypothetical protein V8C34DRAFT_48272 [Trichoderma compactum]
MSRQATSPLGLEPPSTAFRFVAPVLSYMTLLRRIKRWPRFVSQERRADTWMADHMYSTAVRILCARAGNIESRFGEDTREKLILAWSGEPVLWTPANHAWFNGSFAGVSDLLGSGQEASSSSAYGVVSRASLVIDSYSLPTISLYHCFQKPPLPLTQRRRRIFLVRAVDHRQRSSLCIERLCSTRTYRQHHHESFVFSKAAAISVPQLSRDAAPPSGKGPRGLMSIMDQTENFRCLMNSGRTSKYRATNFHLTTWWCLDIPLLFNLYGHSSSSSIFKQQKVSCWILEILTL